jgi:hypothetical protein
MFHVRFDGFRNSLQDPDPGFSWPDLFHYLGSIRTLFFQLTALQVSLFLLNVPKREIFDHADFHDFYAIKSLTVSDFGVKIKICLKNI